MPHQLGARIQDYYDITPSASNNPGDIWSGLPTFGLLSKEPLNGIIITPACDLSNRKVETITYLPIIPVHTYFSTPAFMPDIFREVERQLQVAQMADRLSVIERPGRFSPPSPEVVMRLSKEIQEAESASRISEKTRVALQRSQAGLRLLYRISSSTTEEAPLNDIKLLFGEKPFKSILKDVITNSYRLDIHFLPCDEQDTAWSGVPCHSIALFRYTFSAPVEIFECAQELSLVNWSAVIQSLSDCIPGVDAFRKERPMKRISLKPRFLADLITRYVGMYVRIGSPDFTHQTVTLFADQIGGN